MTQTTNTSDKLAAAARIFKASLPEAKGKFKAYVSGDNANQVDVFSESGLYCTINVRSGLIKGI